LKESNRILVTGSQRSGGTWIGNVLSSNGQCGYIHEPFNNINKRIHNSPIQIPYQFINAELNQASEHKYSSYLDYFLNPRIRFLYKTLLHFNKADSRYILPGRQVARNFKPFKNSIIKDPFALMSSEWLSNFLSWKIVIVIRHPAAFALSMKMKKWVINPKVFVAQHDQTDKFLEDLVELKDSYASVKDKKKDLIGSAIKGWMLLTKVISHYKASHPDWIYVRHEDLSLDPLGKFDELFDILNLDFNNKAKDFIKISTSGESTEGVIRDSKTNIKKWKTQLSSAEINRIKDETANLWPLFYEEKDW